MKIKVCGLKHIDNIQELDKLNIHFIGLNFFEQSKRYIDHTKACVISNYKGHKKVGVFVNARRRYLLDMVKIYNLSMVQLHGDESPQYVNDISDFVDVIKVFSIKEKQDFEKTKEYTNCKYFLFDTKGIERGGTGIKFDWSLLNAYQSNTKFMLAGGIGPKDVQMIKAIQHPQLFAIDINSGFETEPGHKNANLIEQFLKDLLS